MTGAWILLAALVLTAGAAVWHVRRDGRFRDVRAAAAAMRDPASDETPDAAPGHALDEAVDEATWQALGARPGERATLLQFSSAFCAPCRATRVTLADVAGLVPGVAHVEVDAEQHLHLVRRLGVRSTPTTLVLDAAGAERTRATGAPSRDQVLLALSRMTDEAST